MSMKRICLLGANYLLIGLGLCCMCGVAAFLGAGRISTPAHAADSPSFVRILHASPYVGTADVFVDGTKLLSSFAFGAITGYASVPAGPHKVQIALVGKGIGASVLSETLTVSPGTAYTVAAIGSQASDLSLQVFVDNNLLAPGSAKLRVYQLSPDAGTVNINSNGSTVLSGIGYPNASNYLTVASGSYDFNVSSPANDATLTTSVALGANMVESLFMVGMFNGIPKSELVTSQAAGFPNFPNTGSDPNAVSQADAARGQLSPSIPWLWPLGSASLLLIGSGFFIGRVRTKRGARR